METQDHLVPRQTTDVIRSKTTQYVKPGRSKLGIVGGGILAGVLIATTIGLSGCAAVAEPSNSSSNSQTATPVATPVTIEGDTNNDGRLSEHEKEILARFAVIPYVMPDGSVVEIDPKQPLPEAVKAVVTEQVAPAAAFALEGLVGDERHQGLLELGSTVAAQKEATGRNIAVVFQTTAAASGGGMELVWASLATDKDSTGITANADRDAMIAAIQGWASSRDYEVIVIG